MSTQKCACCNTQWKDRPDVSYTNLGSTSRAFVYGMQSLSKFGKQKINLQFCDYHAKNIRSHIRYTDTGILKIKNIITGRWRNATSVGEIV